MANKAEKKTNKNLIIGICIALVVIAIIAVIIVLVMRNNSPSTNNSYFVSDDTKYVLNLDSDSFSTEDGEFQPQKAHLIYYYSGDTITGMKSYYEYANEADAKSAYEYYKANMASEYKNIELDGKFLILTANEADYEGMTAYDIQQQIEFLESINNYKTIENEEDDVKEEVDIKEDSATEEATEESIVKEIEVEEPAE